MNLAELKSKGACVDRAPVRKTINWVHKNDSGEEVTDTFDVWVLRMSFGLIDRLTKTEDGDRSRNAELIAASIRLGEHGEEVFPYDVAYSLQTSLALELVRAIGEVNRLSAAEESDGPKD